MSYATKFYFANALRGLAALAVLVDHYGGGFWFFREQVAAFANSPVLNAVEKPMPLYLSVLWPTPHVQWGGFGVALFFLISGFVIPISLQRYDVRGFLLGRVLRIYPTYVVCFSITILTLFVTTLMYGSTFPYALREVLIHYVPGLRDLMWSRFIDGIVWTLEIELKFYLLCALIAPLVRGGSLWTFTAPVVLGSVAVWVNSRLPGLGTDADAAYQTAILVSANGQMLCFMFIGTALYFRTRGWLGPDQTIAIIVLLFGLFVLAFSQGAYASVFIRAWSYGAALFLFALALAYQQWSGWQNRLLSFFADISYPLYAVHGVLGFVMIRGLIGLGVKVWLTLAITTTVAVSLAWIIHRFVELPTHRIGQRLGRKWSPHERLTGSELTAPAE